MRRKTKGYIYTRVSTSIQVDGYSLDAQKEKLRKYAEYEDMAIVRESLAIIFINFCWLLMKCTMLLRKSSKKSLCERLLNGLTCIRKNRRMETGLGTLFSIFQFL